MTYEQLAAIGYDANRAYARRLGEDPPVWADAGPEEQAIWVAAARWHVQHPGATLAECHDFWLLQEREAGWQYGPLLDNAAREHPYHVPWLVLPDTQRSKVALFRNLVAALIFLEDSQYA